jgi:hypothetical protein
MLVQSVLVAFLLAQRQQEVVVLLAVLVRPFIRRQE